ncbi:MAG: zinc dependent phospholipase C family protein [Promethearchaeota archaeon]
MPMFAIHLSVAKRSIQYFKNSNPEVYDLINNHLEYYLLGSIGPDIFYTPEAFTNENVQRIMTLRGTILELMPNTNGLSDNEIINLAQDIIRRSTSIINSLYNGMLTLLAGDILPSYLFLIQDVPLEDAHNFDERYFGWGDMFHYRLNAKFARKLEQVGKDNNIPELQAFAYGFLSHLATDTVGHSFVNHVVGGPYRTRPIYHHVAESHMDAWYWRDFYGIGENVCTAQLHEWIMIHQGPDPLGEHALSSEFVEGYKEALEETYKPLLDEAFERNGVSVDHKLNEGKHFENAYAATYFWLRYSTELAHVDPPIPPDTLSQIMDDLGNTFLDRANDVLNRHRSWFRPPHISLSTSIPSLSDLKDALEELLHDILNDLEDLISALGEILITLGSAFLQGILYILYLIQLFAYNFWRISRLSAVTVGLLYPEPDEILPEWYTIFHIPINTTKIATYKNFMNLCDLLKARKSAEDLIQKSEKIPDFKSERGEKYYARK